MSISIPEAPVEGTVRLQARPDARYQSGATPGLLGGAADPLIQAGTGLIKGGNEMAEAVAKIQERDDLDASFKAEAQAKDAYLKYQADVQANRRGDGAKGVVQDTDKWFKDTSDNLLKGLANDRQRQVVAKSLAQLRLTGLGQMADYEFKQGEVAFQANAEANKAKSIEMAGRDPTNALKYIDDVMQVNRATALHLGLKDPAVLEAMNLKDTTAIHSNIIKTMVDANDSTAAKAYFEANKGQISSGAYHQIESLFKAGAQKERAQGVVDGLLKAGVSQADGLEQIRTKLKGEDEELARNQWMQHWSDVKIAQATSENDAYQKGKAILAKTGNLNGVPASLRESMGGHWLNLQHDYKSLVVLNRQLAEGKPAKTDLPTYAKLFEMSVNDPEGFRKLDLMQYVDKIGAADLKDLVRRKEKPEKDDVTMGRQLSDTFNIMGWKSDDAKRGQLAIAVRDEVEAFKHTHNGKAPTDEERQKIIDKMLVKGVIKGTGVIFDDSGYAFELRNRGDFGKFAPEPTSKERDELVRRFKARGIKPTDEQINQAYRQWKGF